MRYRFNDKFMFKHLPWAKECHVSGAEWSNWQEGNTAFFISNTSIMSKLEKGSASKETFHQNRTSAGWNWSQGGDLVHADRHNDHHFTHYIDKELLLYPAWMNNLYHLRITRDAFLIL